MQNTLQAETTAITATASPAAPVDAPRALPQSALTNAAPPHTHTESTLAPTSEFARYLLTAWGARYLPRGFFKGILEQANTETTGLFGNARRAVNQWFAKPGDWLQKKFPLSSRDSKIGLAYNAILGLASAALTLDYSWIVYKDIKNMYCETVGADLGKPSDQVTFNDIRHSENKIVKRTMHNFGWKLCERLLVDAFFIPATWLRKEWAGDMVLGAKATQLFAETWKRKTTMFEDLVSFVNHKINPYNGLGQPIGVGEIFDLYQHYSRTFSPDRAFSNVLERSHTESVLWARNEPIFQRNTELMNQTNAYKHPTILDPKTGDAVIQANFTLPIFVHLLGFDLIDTHQPERTQIYIEVGNRHGINGINGMRKMIASGTPLDDVMREYQVTFPPPPQRAPVPKGNERNAVIPKGSTVQIDSAAGQPQPATIIDAASALASPRVAIAQQLA